MNLVTAAMVEGAHEQSAADKEYKNMIDIKRKKKMIPLLRQTFAEIDVNSNGEVTLEELDTAPAELQKVLSELIGSEHVTPRDLFCILDFQMTNAVEVNEFLHCLIKCSTPEGVARLQMDRVMYDLEYMKFVLEDFLTLDGRSRRSDFRSSTSFSLTLGAAPRASAAAFSSEEQ